MAVISSANLLPILDSLGLAYNELTANIKTSTPATNIQTSATNNINRVLALTDIQQAAELAPGVQAYQAAAADPSAAVASIFSTIINGIQKHTGGLNAFLAANSARVTLSFANLFRAIMGSGALTPANVFQDTVVELADFTVTGATTGTFTAQSSLDTTKVGGSQCEVEITTDIGAGALTATLTMVKADGTTENQVVNITSGATATTKFDVGTAANIYTDCSAVAITGGTSGAFKVQDKVLRAAAL